MHTVRISVPQLGRAACLADRALDPIMRLAAGNFRETPNRTHWWNRAPIPPDTLSECLMVRIPGDSQAGSAGPIRSHVPVLGGWKEYVVLRPIRDADWYVAWKYERTTEMSLIRLSGPVRMLRGPSGTDFAGIDAETREQLMLRIVGYGRIGIDRKYASLPLL